MRAVAGSHPLVLVVEDLRPGGAGRGGRRPGSGGPPARAGRGGWEAYGHLAEHGLALLGAGRCLRRLGRPEAAARLRAARAVFERLRAGPLREEAGAWLPGAAAG